MARIRSIKPGFFTSEDVSELPLRARLTWIGLWTHCDDQGRAKDNVKLIKAAVWPLDDVSLREVEDDLATLAAHGRIVRYEVDGRRYLVVVNWHDHQKPNRPTPSKLPAPPASLPPPPAPPADPDPFTDSDGDPVDNEDGGYPQGEELSTGETGDATRNGPRTDHTQLTESSRTTPVRRGVGGEGRGVSPRGRTREAIRWLQDRYKLTDHEASQVLEAVEARAAAPIAHPIPYMAAMELGDLADIVAAAMDTTGPPEPADRPPGRDPWCGQCDEHTRLLDPDKPRRCPACHPLRGETA